MTTETPGAEAAPNATETAQATPSVRKYSYSHKRLNAFDLWQEQARKAGAAKPV